MISESFFILYQMKLGEGQNEMSGLSKRNLFAMVSKIAS